MFIYYFFIYFLIYFCYMHIYDISEVLETKTREQNGDHQKTEYKLKKFHPKTTFG